MFYFIYCVIILLELIIITNLSSQIHVIIPTPTRVKYIEEELSKRKSKNSNDEVNSANNEKGSYCSPEEAALRAVPEHLRQSSANRSEEMLSNQMLSGIPEVDLGIE